MHSRLGAVAHSPCPAPRASMLLHMAHLGKDNKLKIWNMASTECVLLLCHYKVEKL